MDIPGLQTSTSISIEQHIQSDFIYTVAVRFISILLTEHSSGPPPQSGCPTQPQDHKLSPALVFDRSGHLDSDGATIVDTPINAAKGTLAQDRAKLEVVKGDRF